MRNNTDIDARMYNALTHTHARAHTHARTCTLIHTCAHTRKHAHANTSARTHLGLRIMHTFTHTCTHNLRLHTRRTRANTHIRIKQLAKSNKNTTQHSRYNRLILFSLTITSSVGIKKSEGISNPKC